MKITAVKAFAVQGPWVDLCFVKIETDQQGLVGWGEASLPGKSAAVAQAIRDSEALALGMDPIAGERVWQRLYRHSYWRGGPILTSSISGIDMALWDIRGQAAGMPVYRLLGGPVRDTIPLYANIGDTSDPVEARARAERACALGYRAVKFYPLVANGATDRHDAVDVVVSCAEALRDVLGPERGFAIDFHGRLSPALAIEIEDSVRHTRPMWIEEPIRAEDLGGYRKLAANFVVPLAFGERLFTRWGFQRVFEERLANIVQPDVANAGGISEMMRIGALAELYSMSVAPHNPNGPVQSVANLHLAAAMPAFSILEHLYDSVELLGELASFSPAARSDGTIALPSKPGLGVECDETKLLARPSTAFNWDLYRADGAVADW